MTNKPKPKYHVQGEVTIFYDFLEEEADTKEEALKASKEWLKNEYCRGLGYDDYDITLTIEEE